MISQTMLQIRSAAEANIRLGDGVPCGKDVRAVEMHCAVGHAG